ncbi:MAG: phenol hydroxylase [Glaciimonas sp.]|nr:phenol hydroxylase [Glaciimonas sp.]
MENKIFDTTRKFVRVIEARQDGLIEFEFAIGEPELFVELIMPASAFAEFCAVNQVTTLDQARSLKNAGADEEDDALAWSLHSARNKVSGDK